MSTARTLKNSLFAHQVEHYCHFVGIAGSFDTAMKYSDQKLNKIPKNPKKGHDDPVCHLVMP